MPISVATSGAVATVTLERPEKKNALDKPMRVEFPLAMERLQDDVSIRAIVLTGAGHDFCAGADVREMGGRSIAESFGRIEILHRMVRALSRTDVPVIAAVRGVCVGVGWSMALACDYIIASPDARFQFAFRHIGLAPDGGAVHLLSRNLGTLRAKSLIYSGRFVSGEEASGLGLVSELAPAAEVQSRAAALAADLADAPTLALRMAKRQFAAAEAQTYEEALSAEMAMQALMVQSQDFQEGAAAFREKRKAHYKGS